MRSKADSNLLTVWSDKEAAMKLNTDSFVGVGICILGLLGVGYALASTPR